MGILDDFRAARVAFAHAQKQERQPSQLARMPEATPLEGTNMSLFWSQIPDFWAETYGGSSGFISPAMAEKVWVANRCMQLNAQQIAAMPLHFHSTAEGGGYEPAWISSPDPNWYPNGISDVIFSIVKQIYGWGFSCQLVTSRYANGFPQTWTVIDSALMSINVEKGRRTYKAGEQELDPDDVIQIDRNPSSAIHGTSAIRAFATQAWGLLAGSELSRSVMQGGVPTSVLKSERKLTSEQAEKLQTQWVARTAERGGAPPVLPPEVSFETLSMSPEDLLLIEGLEFDARIIASAYGVPAFLLNLVLAGGLTYQNPAMLGEYWWRFELRTTAKRITDAFTAQMLPRGNWVDFDAADTFAPLIDTEDDVQLSLPPDAPPIAGATPADQNGNGVRPIRPLEVSV